MKLTVLLTIITVLFIYFVPPCYSIDLDSNNLVNNVIKSLDEERDKWIIRGTSLYYINGPIDSDLRNKSWPEYDDKCLVEIDHYLFYPDPRRCSISFDKPVELRVEGNDKTKLTRKIRQVLYEELHNRYNARTPKKEIVLNIKPEPEEPIVEVDKDGLKPL
jgi:hypothetical protein